MRKKLGGSLFIHNAIEFDYCITEAINSLCAVCDRVVVLDAQSTDNTLEVLKSLAKGQPKLRVFEGGIWECAKNYDRLAILGNQARQYLDTEWHFMLQADNYLSH